MKILPQTIELDHKAKLIECYSTNFLRSNTSFSSAKFKEGFAVTNNSFELKLSHLQKRVSANWRMLFLLVLGFCMELLHVNGESESHTGGCTATCTATCNTSSKQCCNDCKAIDSIEHKLQQLDAKLDRLMVHANITDLYPPSSLLHFCEEINTNWPDSPSDYYIIADTNGHPRHIYCHMESLCNSSGGWMRVAYLNMSDPTEECPPGFRLYNQNGIKACGRPTSLPVNSCQSVKFLSYSISYSQICGQVIGYQYAHTDAIGGGRNNLNEAYVDGVSITRGNP